MSPSRSTASDTGEAIIRRALRRSLAGLVLLAVLLGAAVLFWRWSDQEPPELLEHALDTPNPVEEPSRSQPPYPGWPTRPV